MKALYDNNLNCETTLQEFCEAKDVDCVRKDLKTISEIELSKLTKEKPNLLVFPSNIKDSEDRIGNSSIIKLIEKDGVTKIRTGNLMGFIRVGNTDIRIKSRFDKDSENDLFLHYMLQRIFKINLVNYNTNSTQNDFCLNLLYLMFVPLLQKALRKGIYRKYMTFARNDAAVKGPIDVARYIKIDVPFNGKIAYNSREFSADNEVTELIRHTIEVMKLNDIGKVVLSNDQEIKQSVSQIVQATPLYYKKERMSIIHKNIKPLKHSFFSEYDELRKICLAILYKHTLAYNQNNSNEVYGILFDGAWLWEEYLATILIKCGFKHPENKTGKGGIPLFMNPEYEDIVTDNTYHSLHRRYPDFYKEGKIILDAKYKNLYDKNTIPREDLHQIITYMYSQKADLGGLIYPIPCEKAGDNIKPKGAKLRGFGGTITTYGFPIPTQGCKDMLVFRKRMEKLEKELKEKF